MVLLSSQDMYKIQIEPELTEVNEPAKSAYGQKTVLYVDPDIPSFLFVRLVLDDYHVELIHARTGSAAIKLLRERTNVAGIITELKVPEQDGFGILREARQLKPGIPVIALTASVLFDIEEKCRMAGFNEFISKPVNVTNFITKLKDLGLTGPLDEQSGQ